MTGASTQVKIIGKCQTMIQEKLGVYSAQNLALICADIYADEVLHESHIEKKNVEMNYCNYKSKTVEKYGVTLEGWPNGIPQVCNLSMVAAGSCSKDSSIL